MGKKCSRKLCHSCVEHILWDREEHGQFGREEKKREQLIREQSARERREREERELLEAENWPQQPEAITGRSHWLCEHYQRHCRVRFPCCTQFYPCHRCHNISKACDNEDVKACHATHLQCSYCQEEQEVMFYFHLWWIECIDDVCVVIESVFFILTQWSQYLFLYVIYIV